MDTSKITRVEVINHQDDIPGYGRVFTKWDCRKVEIQTQDEGRTLKLFIG